MTSCTIRNYRPQVYKEVSSAEYIRKKEFKDQNKFQNDGLPSGIYGFITNLDGDTSDDERVRIRRGEQMTDYVMNRAFLLDNQETSIDDDECDKKLNRYELFRVLSYGMIFNALARLGVINKFSDPTNPGNIYYITKLEKYKAELGIDSDRTVEQAINLFEGKYNEASGDDLLLYPIRYLLEKYDGICNYANNTSSGGSVHFKDIKPRVGTMGGVGNLYSFQSKKGKAKKSAKKRKSAKIPKKSPKKRKSAKIQKKSPKKRQSVKKGKSTKKRSKLL